MKRTFSGQMMLTICLIFLTLIVLLTATQLLYYRSTLGLMQEDLTASASAMAEMTRFCRTQPDSQAALRVQLSYTARATGNDTVVLDADGTVTACSCGMQNCEHLGFRFPRELLDKSAVGKVYFTPGVNLSCYDGKRMAAVLAVTDPEQGQSGYVVSSRTAKTVSHSMVEATRINLFVVLAVMVLAIPLVWFIARRQTGPMKSLTAAARKMAHGQMDVRVPTEETDTAEVSELAVAFNNMADALGKSEQKRQEFVANVSHELKTPMTTISGYMDGMLDGTIPAEEYPKYMTIISGEVKRLSRLVRSMLEISRIQDQGIPIQRKSNFDVCQTVGEVLLSFEQKINDKHLEVETNLPDLGARVFADLDSITQVVYNLIDNAVKFCPQGGTLGLGVTETRKGKYLVSVKNTGPTIPPEELALVFDRFHKTDKSRSVDREGVGLGLYIVKTIILSHEEDIYVTSRDGVTEFSFTLPKAQA